MKPLKVVLLDVDGTLVDSNDAHAQAWLEVLEQNGYRTTFERVRELFRDRAVLLISHRFANVRSADQIYVLRSGQIIEQGDHETLMAKDGLYAELFGMQAAAYIGEA